MAVRPNYSKEPDVIKSSHRNDRVLDDQTRQEWLEAWYPDVDEDESEQESYPDTWRKVTVMISEDGEVHCVSAGKTCDCDCDCECESGWTRLKGRLNDQTEQT